MPESNQAVPNDSTADSTADEQRELLIVDERIPERDTLIAELTPPGCAALEVVAINADQSGISEIADVLAQHTGLARLHIVPLDGLQIGTDWLTRDILIAAVAEISAWGSALASDAELILYSGDLELSVEGRGLRKGLAALTGAKVCGKASPIALVAPPSRAEVENGCAAAAVEDVVEEEPPADCPPAVTDEEGTVLLSGSFTHTPNAALRLEFVAAADTTGDEEGGPEGRSLGFAFATTDESGTATFSVRLSALVEHGTAIDVRASDSTGTATALDLDLVATRGTIPELVEESDEDFVEIVEDTVDAGLDALAGAVASNAEAVLDLDSGLDALADAVSEQASALDSDSVADADLDTDLATFYGEDMDDPAAAPADAGSAAPGDGVAIDAMTVADAEAEPELALDSEFVDPDDDVAFDVTIANAEPEAESAFDSEPADPDDDVAFDVTVADAAPEAESAFDSELADPDDDVAFDVTVADTEPETESAFETEPADPDDDVAFDVTVADAAPETESAFDSEPADPDDDVAFDVTVADAAPEAESAFDSEPADPDDDVAFDVTVADAEPESAFDSEIADPDDDVAFDVTVADAETESVFDSEPGGAEADVAVEESVTEPEMDAAGVFDSEFDAADDGVESHAYVAECVEGSECAGTADAETTDTPMPFDDAPAADPVCVETPVFASSVDTVPVVPTEAIALADVQYDESTSTLQVDVAPSSDETMTRIPGKLSLDFVNANYGTATMSVRAGRPDGGTVIGAFTVLVRPVPDGPSLPEREAGGTEPVFTVGSIPPNMQLTLNGTSLAVGAKFTSSEAADGRLAYVRDGSESGTSSFRLMVSDPSGETLRIIVAAVIQSTGEPTTASDSLADAGGDGRLCFATPPDVDITDRTRDSLVRGLEVDPQRAVIRFGAAGDVVGAVATGSALWRLRGSALMACTLGLLPGFLHAEASVELCEAG